MSVDFSIFDDLTTLRILHNMQKNVQKYSQGDKSPENKKAIIESFIVFIANNEELKRNLNEVISSTIKSRISKVSFNPLAYKRPETIEASKAQSRNKKNEKHNSKMEKIKKQVHEEIKFAKSKGKFTDIPDEPELISIAISDDKRKFLIQVADRKENVEIPIYINKGKAFSSIGLSCFQSRIKQKSGINNATYNDIIDAGTNGIIFETQTVTKKTNKKYTDANYKTFLGLSRGEKLSDANKKELGILNSLATAEEQTNFIAGLLEYVQKAKAHKELIDEIEKTENKLELIINSQNLANLLKKYKVDDFSNAVQENFINSIILNDKKNIWQHFSQKGNENGNNEYYSEYEKLMLNVISKNKEIFENMLDFNNHEEMEKNIATAFSNIKKLKSPNLTDDLCAEILTLGVFKEGISKDTNNNKIKNMNLVLNEFGLKIKLHPLPVTKVPDVSIKTAAEQAKIDRGNFADSKKEYLWELKAFDEQLKSMGITEPAEKDVHHYYALRYNAFVNQDLNSPKNYVQTAKENYWNISGHDFTHRYDVSGEFLIRKGDGSFTKMGFNSLRKNFENDKNMQIMALTLQTKDDRGNFSDLLKPADKIGKFGTYISSDKTQQNLISVPKYCKSQSNDRNIVARILSDSKSHKK